MQSPASDGSRYEAVNTYLCFGRHWSVVLCRQNLWGCLKLNCSFIVSPWGYNSSNYACRLILPWGSVRCRGCFEERHSY